MVSVAVQAHPLRADCAEAIAACADAEIVWDPEPDGHRNPWRTYREALLRTPPDADARCVVQDDVWLCDDFRAALDLAVAARPDRVLCLFHAGRPAENLPVLQRALDRGVTWALLSSQRWVPTVALVWPVRLVRTVVEWVDAQDYPRGFTADDEIVGRALRALGEPVLCCVPSIVEHEDLLPAVRGQKASGGWDSGRVAAFWLGERSALALDWTSGQV